MGGLGARNGAAESKKNKEKGQVLGERVLTTLASPPNQRVPAGEVRATRFFCFFFFFFVARHHDSLDNGCLKVRRP